MTKSKTIIATLGIVAGLGAAALPLASYATQSITGTVKLAVEVEPAIAMTIVGNNDGGTHKQTTDTTTSYASVDSFAPASIASDASNTYNLGNHEIPQTAVTGVSSSYISLLPNSSVHGNDTNEFKSTIAVWTNDADGYTLGISAPAALTGENGGTIAADGLVKAGHAGWGYSKTIVAEDATGSTANYAYEANASLTTRTTATPAAGEVTTVYYGVSTDGAQPTGIYNSTLTYTATTTN